MTNLSRAVGKFLCNLNIPDSEVLLSRECGGKERVQFFHKYPTSRKNSFVWVDAAVVVDGEIKVVIEIEESNITPVQFFGMVFATAASRSYKGKRGDFPLSEALLFIQVFVKKPGNVSKREQCINLEQAIQEMCRGTRISKYSFHWGTWQEFQDDPCHERALADEIRGFLDAGLNANCPSDRPVVQGS